METFLSTSFLGRTVRDFLVAALVLVGGILIALAVRTAATTIMIRRTKRLGGEPHGMEAFGLRAVTKFLFPALVLASLYGAVAVVRLQGTAATVSNGVFVVLLSLIAIRFVVSFVNASFRTASEREGRVDMKRVRPIRSLSVLVIWVVGLLFLLDNLGFDITTVVAGLGITGIAVALAAQALLGDLFSYFIILFDKPFEIGDFLLVGETMGSVERIGIKTTRLRSLSGEQISVSNSDLTGSRIRNFRRMETRRVVIHLRVEFGTPAEKLRLIPGIVQEIVTAQESVAFDRAHLAGFGEWNIFFEVVYNVLTPDYNTHMDIQQRIHLSICERFEAEGIRFAVPARAVRIDGAGGPSPGDAGRAAP